MCCGGGGFWLVRAQATGGVEKGHAHHSDSVHGEGAEKGQDHRRMALSCTCGGGGQPPMCLGHGDGGVDLLDRFVDSSSCLGVANGGGYGIHH